MRVMLPRSWRERSCGLNDFEDVQNAGQWCTISMKRVGVRYDVGMEGEKE